MSPHNRNRGHMLSVRCLVVAMVAFLATTFITDPASAQDLPFMAGAAHSVETSGISVQCEEILVWKGPRRARCAVVQTSFSRPDPEKIRLQVEGIDASMLSGEDRRKARSMFKKCSEFASDPHATEAEQKYLNESRVACEAKNELGMMQAYRDWVINVEANTCKLLTVTNMWEFVQVDKNTWRHTSSTGLCDITLDVTLWRTGSHDLWNFHQSRTWPTKPRDNLPDLLSDLCKVGLLTPIFEYKWRDQRVKELGCRYIEL